MHSKLKKYTIILFLVASLASFNQVESLNTRKYISIIISFYLQIFPVYFLDFMISEASYQYDNNLFLIQTIISISKLIYFIFEANLTKIILNSINQIMLFFINDTNKIFFIIFQLLTYLFLSISNSWLEYLSLLSFSAAFFYNYIKKNLNPLGMNKIIFMNLGYQICYNYAQFKNGIKNLTFFNIGFLAQLITGILIDDIKDSIEDCEEEITSLATLSPEFTPILTFFMIALFTLFQGFKVWTQIFNFNNIVVNPKLVSDIIIFLGIIGNFFSLRKVVNSCFNKTCNHYYKNILELMAK